MTRQAGLRVIAATNRETEKACGRGIVPRGLYFRLNVITVEMPPLRSRDRDLIRFAEHYEIFRQVRSLTRKRNFRPSGGVHPGIWVVGQPARTAQCH